MDEDALESSSEEGSSLDEPSWVSWFCMLRNHEFFCEVDPAFVQDRFNLYGLKEVVGPLYGEAMTMILCYAPTGACRTRPQQPLPTGAVRAVRAGGATRAFCQPVSGPPFLRRLDSVSRPSLPSRLERCTRPRSSLSVRLVRLQRSNSRIRRSAFTRCWSPRGSCMG